MADLFTSFEVNRESHWRIILQLIAASVVLHVALAASVLYIPTFRDAFNIALLAGKTNYVDRAYRRTIVGENVQMVMAGPRFRYPDGYFGTGFAAPLTAPTPDPLAPKIISTYTPPPKPQGTPLPIPSPTPSPSPSASAGSAIAVNSGSGAPTPAGEKASVGGKTEPATDAKKSDDDEVLGIKEDEINTRPLKDWLARANALKEKGLLDLNADLEMTIDARLNSDCKLDEPKVVQKAGDQQMVEVAKDLAAAISDSRTLLFLNDPEKVQKEQAAKALHCDAMPLRFTVKLDQSDFNATLEIQADSSDRAAQLTRLYNWALAGGEIKRRGKEEEVIFKNTKVTAEGKQILVHFKIPRATGAEKLKKQIEPKPAG